MTPADRLAEIETLSKAADAAPEATLRKCEELIEDRVRDRVAAGETERVARDFVLSGRDPIGSRLYKLSCDLSDQLAYQRSVMRDTH